MKNHISENFQAEAFDISHHKTPTFLPSITVFTKILSIRAYPHYIS